MASSLECLGLSGPVDDQLAALQSVVALLPHDLPVVARDDDLAVVRYDDPSGVRITLTQTPDLQVVDLLPSLAGRPGAHLHEVTASTAEPVLADVHDDDGELLTRLAVDLVQSRFLPEGGSTGPAAVTALAHDVTVHDDVPAYVASIGDGLPWGAESFVPVGMFGDGPPTPFAQLSGVVLDASTRRVALTGRQIHVARVRSVGFEAEVLLDPAEHPHLPPVGGVVTGIVYLIAEMEQLYPPQRRRWFARRP